MAERKRRKKKQSNSRSARCGRAADAIREVVQTIRDAITEIELIAEGSGPVKLNPENFKNLPTEIDVGDFEELKDELQSWFDNLPESLQGGDTGSRLEEAISNLESAIDTISGISIPDVPTGELDDDALESFRGDLENAADELEGGADEAEGTEFPGMYGR